MCKAFSFYHLFNLNFKKMKSFKLILSILFFSVVITSCKKKTIDPVPTPTPTPDPYAAYVKVGETFIIGAKAKAVVYSTHALHTGYNNIFVVFYDSADGSKLSSGHMSITPMMDMGTMQHSAPVENFTDSLPSGGMFRSNVVYSMPGTASEWSLQIAFHNHKNDLEGTGKLGTAVANLTPARLISTTIAADSNAKVFISWIAPDTAKVGINNFEIVLHQKASMMSFPPIENYTIAIEPFMPSMGHGSPNNVNPVHTGNGHYTGKVNFTMNGLWQVKLKLYKNGTLLTDSLYFETTL